MGKHRRLGGVAGDDGDRKASIPFSSSAARRCHRLVQAVIQRLRTRGDRESPAGGASSLAGRQRQKTAAIGSSASIRWMAGGLASAAHPQDGQRRVQVPPPARLEQRRVAPADTCSTVLEARNFGTVSGKLCCSPETAAKMALSLAAAAGSKSNVTQNPARASRTRGSPGRRTARADQLHQRPRRRSVPG